MCMCYEDECRHKKIKPKPLLKFEKIEIKPIPKPAHKNIIINEAYYKEVVGIAADHFIRCVDDKLMFYTGREDMPFMHLNMAKKFTLRHANHIMQYLDVECEAITLSGLKKEL